MPWRIKAVLKVRRLTASVSSREGKYSPPVTEVRASSRKLFPCRRLPLTTPSSALRTGFDAKEARPFHSRSRSNTRSGFGIMPPPLRRVLEHLQKYSFENYGFASFGRVSLLHDKTARVGRCTSRQAYGRRAPDPP